MSGAPVDRLIPSVEYARREYLRLWNESKYSGFMCCDGCDDNEAQHMAALIEAAAVALDMANAQASDRRRAEDDEIRRGVAW